MSREIRITLRFVLIQISTLAVLVLFVSLGSWQLERGNVKHGIEKSLSKDDTEFVQASLPLASLADWRYKNIKLQGNYLADKQFLLDNQIRDGVAGYAVLTPYFVERSQDWVLVDRGWVPQGHDRSFLPDISLNETLNTISGSVYVPYDDSFSLGGIAEGEDKGWPRRIQFVDYQQLGQRLQLELQPFTLRLNSDEPNGYQRDWLQSQMSASKHYGYAFQWYAMALAVLVLWWIYSIRPLLKRTSNK
ncbi:MAG: SURF1 family protein [Pseudomonadota bacterium]